ncbi:MAG: Gfo/Idh/MocA family oxidoreductase [Verrucomicrobia bacterium]|nr:Gfo/Idh/MocA family oxidoreductase [Verrucomicrobiota bacterium]
MNARIGRRQFIKHTSLTAAGLWLAGGRFFSAKGSPNEKLDIGFIGVANRAGDDLNEVAREIDSVNVAALCDIDDNFLAKAKAKYPGAKTYNDFRRLLDHKGLDAIVVGTPDHTHAVATVAALRSGRHVYCEKPLTHTVSEARIVAEAARKRKRVTQIGTQIHAGTNYRRVVELIQRDAIGPVNEVHVWVAATYGGMERPKETPPVPPNVHYDLWLGPVAYRPYSPEYLPFKWRNWWAFGGGALADFGCHYMDLPHWALELRHPLTVEVVDGPPVHPESTPPWLIVRYEYPSRGGKPPVKLTWYHGGKKPELLAPDVTAKWNSGVLFIGSKGMLLSDYNRHQLLPEKDFAGFVPPQPFIPNSIGHHKEWVEACKTGGPTTCNFDYSGALTEAALLGNAAYRVGQKLQWDAKTLKATNCPEADQFIQHHYRRGWRI